MIDEKNNKKLYNYLSMIIIGLSAVFSFTQFTSSPQFIDGYYHLACANAFLKSGGWVGVDWWSIAPLQRAHLYPPVYHFILIVLQYCGLTGIKAVVLGECLIVPVFFFVFWNVFRKRISTLFSYYFLLLIFSFFYFYSSISSNMPASLAIIFGILSWDFLQKKKIIPSTLFLALTSYTHTGMFLIFSFAFLFAGMWGKKSKYNYWKIVFFAFLLAAPLIYHQIRNADQLSFIVLKESTAIHFNLFAFLLAAGSFFYISKLRDYYPSYLFFCGYSLASIAVFFKYPYRLFCAQGMIGFIWFAAFSLEQISKKIKPQKKLIALLLLTLFFFIFYPTIYLHNGESELELFSSTYSQIFSGGWKKNVKFNVIYNEKIFNPVLNLIKENSEQSDIISSNNELCAQIFTALSGRPGAQTTYKEIGREKSNQWLSGKIIVLLKDADAQTILSMDNPQLEKIFENDVFYVFVNHSFKTKARPIKSKFSFGIIFLAGLIFSSALLWDNCLFIIKKQS